MQLARFCLFSCFICGQKWVISTVISFNTKYYLRYRVRGGLRLEQLMLHYTPKWLKIGLKFKLIISYIESNSVISLCFFPIQLCIVQARITPWVNRFKRQSLHQVHCQILKNKLKNINSTIKIDSAFYLVIDWYILQSSVLFFI